MMSNTFGIQNNAVLFTYDSSNKYSTLSTTCNLNPQYNSYCFDPSVNVDGDYVNIVVHGYMVQFNSDVSIVRESIINISLILNSFPFSHIQIFWQVQIQGDGSIYTGNYSTYMKFVYQRDIVNKRETYKILLSQDSQNLQPTFFTWYAIFVFCMFINIVNYISNLVINAPLESVYPGTHHLLLLQCRQSIRSRHHPQ